MSELFTVDEYTALAECEATIRRGLNTFVDVGEALARIRDERLYRVDYASFEDYLGQRWQMSRPRAYELISAAHTVSAMADKLPDTVPPANERQARELARVPEEQRAEVWQRVVETTDGRPTATAIREAANAPGDVPSTAFIPPQALSPEEREQRRREQVATDLLTDLILSLSQLSGSDEFEYYQPAIARPRPIDPEMLDRATESIDKTRTALTSKGML